MQGPSVAYGELPPSLCRSLHEGNLDANASTSKHVPAATSFAGLVPRPAHPSIPTKLANKNFPLENPAKPSDRRKNDEEVKREERRKRKIANKRRRSGRTTKEEEKSQGVSWSKARPLCQGRVSYELMEPLHRLWLGYISELLGLTFRDAMSPSQAAAAIGDQTSDSPKDQAASTEADAGSSTVAVTFETKSVLQDNVPLNQMQGWQAKLVKADFHGAKVEVVKAKHPSLVGLKGIIVQETEGTFRIVTAKNRVKVVPKRNVDFSLSLPLTSKDPGVQKDLYFELHGGNFAFRSADRANKKFKSHGTRGFEF